MQTTSDETYEFGDFTLNLTRGCLYRGLDKLDLPRKPFEVLTYMVKHPLKLIKKEELIDHVWGKDHAGAEGSLVHYITMIRKALGDEQHKKIIVTRHTLGYSFNPGAARVSREAETPASSSQSSNRGVQKTPDPEPALAVDVPATKTGQPPQGSQEVQRVAADPPQLIQDVAEQSPPADDEPLWIEGKVERIPLEIETEKDATNGESVADDLSIDLPAAEPEIVSPALADGTGTFEGWIGGHGMMLTLTLSVLVLVVTPVLSIYVATRSGDAAAMKAASWAQCLVILIALAHSWFFNPSRRFKSRGDYSEANVKKAGFKSVADFELERSALMSELGRYTAQWRLLLLSWVPLYVLFAVGNLNTVRDQIIQVILNILNTWMLLGCFNVLNKDPDDQDDQHLTGTVLNYILFIVLLGAVAVLIASRNFAVATLLTGIAAGVFMALFVGRLQSKFLGPRIWILYLLYSYTAIQPTVLYFESHPRWGIIILDFALILKSLLYLYMTWLFQSGLLLFYFARMKRTSGSVRKQRDAFRTLLK